MALKKTTWPQVEKSQEHTANPQEKRKSKAKKKKGEDGDEDVQWQGQREGPRPDLQVHPGVHLRVHPGVMLKVPLSAAHSEMAKVFVFDAAERAAERKSFGLLKDQLSAVLQSFGKSFNLGLWKGLLKDQLSAVLSELAESRSFSRFGKELPNVALSV
ncbi:hypothetical protein B0H10DRAFT_1958475 [Mycena sp. CBHHK59/15]|nr:hypothetical protein B0H10DRAFT_1958475 [Mycena sp. CBHHK59/15]